ncbi:MAG: helix-turn-helix transcriptional regulator [Plesiomonas sp.]|uniref:helix-turn-helix transcriptional regulator n=1 Tax=Plesiomonas sp. TaxID=2486279 RepID=UPI003EE5BE71
MKTADIILHRLKSQGALSAKMLAADLGMTTMGIRQHMQLLEQQQLVQFDDQRLKIGRPTRYWSLTAQGHATFPDRHADLSAGLLISIRKLYGEPMLNQLMSEREEQLYQQYHGALLHAQTLEARLSALVRLRQNEGYMAELHPYAGGFLLIEQHCPICSAASACQALCTSELHLFQRLLGEPYQVERIEHIVGGDRRCAYAISAR